MEAYIKHHGVDGQKWGVQNGPPYPLDSNKAVQKKRKMNYEEAEKDIQDVSKVTTDTLTAVKGVTDLKTKNFKKEYKRLSNEELKKYNERRKLEETYAGYRAKETKGQSASDKIEKTLAIVGATTGIALTAVTLAKIVQEMRNGNGGN